MPKSRVFIVEDEAIVAADLADRLIALGFVVAGSADTGARALAEIPSSHADVVLMDIVLKGPIDGVETSRQLRPLCDVPVVYLTSHADNRTVRAAVGTDPYGYVLKPFNDRELQVAIRIALHRHGTETRLRRLERWMSALLESIGDGVVATDADGRITLVNAAAQRLTGWADDEALGRQFDEVLRLVDAYSSRPLSGLVDKAQAGSFEVGVDVPVLLERRDGSTLPVDDSVAPIRDDQGEAAGAVVVFRDATMRLEAERLRRDKLAAELASEQKTRFLSRVSHELRNPLNAILGFTELLQRDVASPLDTSQRRRVDLLQAAGQHLLSLINDVLDLSRIEQGARPLQIRAIALEPAVQEVTGLLAEDARRAGVTLECVPPPQPLSVAADARALAQVLLNLVSNGIKYNRRGGRLLIDSRLRGAEVEVGIADEGLGLSPAQLAQLFQPFNRLGAETTGATGTGLGLVIAKGLIEAMGGRLEASSTEGAGTRFALALPQAEMQLDARVAAQTAQAAVPMQAPAATLLYIEDDPVNALLFTEALRSTPQWRVVLAADGNEGLAIARRTLPDLVITDVNLPGKSGLEVVRALRADPATTSLRCIALSADAMPAQVEVGSQSGFDAYWTKPVDLATLTERLREWLPAAPP